MSLAVANVAALDNGFGRTPVMGFNTYNDVACTVNETYIHDSVTAFVSGGFPGLGYKYFQMDCGWAASQRQGSQGITPDTTRFPNGISPLSQLATSQGLAWSMYTDQGVLMCDTGAKRVGSLGYEQQDAAQFAKWNVTYMKVDNCYITADQNAPKDPRTDFPSRYGAMASALQNVGILGMLVCQWGTPYSSPSGLQGPALWTPALATSYRVSDDIASGWANVMRIMNEAIHVALYGLTGPGHYADMDLLEVGNPGMTVDEQASHFAIWAMFKSALMVSTSLTHMSTATKNILQNKGLIAINQDSLGAPVKLVQRYTNDNDQFAGPLTNGDLAVLLLDQSNSARSLTLNLNQYNISTATVTDLWTGKVATNVASYSTNVNAHGSMAVRLSNIKYAIPSSPRWTYIEGEAGTASNGANIQSCSGCSGGRKAGNIGGSSNGKLTWTGIRTSQSSQDILVDYIDCEIGYLAGQGTNTRSASISVNNGPAQVVSFPLTGYNWDQDVLKQFRVRLSGFNTGAPNTISISGVQGSTQWGPDIDRIAVVA